MKIESSDLKFEQELVRQGLLALKKVHSTLVVKFAFHAKVSILGC